MWEIFVRQEDTMEMDNKNTETKQSKPKKKMGKVKKVLLIILIVLLSLILALGVTFSIMYYNGYTSLTDKSTMKISLPEKAKTQDNGDIIKYNGKTYKYNDSMTSILFMGIDEKEEDTAEDKDVGRADAIYLLAMDTDTGKTTTFQISRNTMCDVDVFNPEGKFLSTENSQICLSYSYGDGKEKSAENTIRSVRRLFYGLPVAQSYVAMNIDGIMALNDSIGGVTLTSPVDYDEFVKGNTYTLYGEQAEKFVRNRSHTEVEYNESRMTRQKAYLNAFISQVIKTAKEDITSVKTLYDTASPYVVTDISASKASYLAVNYIRKGISNINITKIPGKDHKGKEFVEYDVDHNKFFQMVINTFYEEVK